MSNLEEKLKEIEHDKRRVLSNYKKQRHLELLKRSGELEKLSIDSSEEALELSYYSGLLQEQLNWETRDHYLQLQEELLTNKITIGEFCHLFCKRDVLNSEAGGMLESNLILLSPHSKSLDFSKLTDEILEACYVYDPDAESYEIHEIEKKNFRNLVQTIYLQLQKLLEE
jgi:hypothetical protein